MVIVGADELDRRKPLPVTAGFRIFDPSKMELMEAHDKRGLLHLQKQLDAVDRNIARLRLLLRPYGLLETATKALRLSIRTRRLRQIVALKFRMEEDYE